MAFSVSTISRATTSQLRNARITPATSIALALASTPFAIKAVHDVGLHPHPKRTKHLPDPTLIIPGITHKGKDMIPMRDFLQSKDKAAHIWGPDRNNGPTRFAVHKLNNLLNNFHDEVGEPVYIIGYSFGGLMGLFLGHMHPEKVKAIIILASPDLLGYEDIASKTVFGSLFKYIDHAGFLFNQKILRNWVGEHKRPPLGIPIISFIACNDKTVSAPSCEAPENSLNRNFYVDCDHTQMKDHPGVMAAIAYLQENGLYADLPDEILAMGFVGREKMIDHFPTIQDLQNTIEHPPLTLDIGVMSYS